MIYILNQIPSETMKQKNTLQDWEIDSESGVDAIQDYRVEKYRPPAVKN